MNGKWNKERDEEKKEQNKIIEKNKEWKTKGKK